MLYKSIHERLCYKAIQDGTPIPDNATNGDAIKAMFDVAEEHFYDEDRMVEYGNKLEKYLIQGTALGIQGAKTVLMHFYFDIRQHIR